MRHLKAHKKLGMDSSHRKAVLRNMVTSLIEHERIQTTETRAKELRPVVEKIITLGKRGGLHALRQSLEVIRTKDAAKKLFDELGPRFKDVSGGYTRIIKTGRRHGDNAPVAFIEFTVKKQETAPDKKAAKAEKKPAKAKADKAEKKPAAKKAAKAGDAAAAAKPAKKPKKAAAEPKE